MFDGYMFFQSCRTLIFATNYKIIVVCALPSSVESVAALCTVLLLSDRRCATRYVGQDAQYSATAE